CFIGIRIVFHLTARFPSQHWAVKPTGVAAISRSHAWDRVLSLREGSRAGVEPIAGGEPILERQCSERHAMNQVLRYDWDGGRFKGIAICEKVRAFWGLIAM